MPFKYLYDAANEWLNSIKPGVDLFQEIGYGIQFIIDIHVKL